MSNFLNSINKLVTLKKIKFNNNNFTDFPNLDKCINLEIINFRNNRLEKTIPEDTFKKFTKLKELNLSINKLEFLPDSICDLLNLKKLIVSLNLLKRLPENIGNLVNLEVLDVYNNKIEDLPDNIDNLKNLKTFEFNNNNKLIDLLNEMGSTSQRFNNSI